MADRYAQLNSYSQLVQALNGVLAAIGTLAGGSALLWSAYTSHNNAGNRTAASHAVREYQSCEEQMQELEEEKKYLLNRIAQCHV